jgi:SAM-dependent methyltransferase
MNKAPAYDPQAFKEFEHSGWEAAASHYHDLFGATTSQSAGPLLDAVKAGEGTRLLDLACGPGQVTAAALRRGAEAVGLDFSAAMVAEARRRYPEIRFQEGDAENMPFDAGSFEAVVCSFGMHHFPHADRAIAEARRVLAPGGRFAFTVWLEGSELNKVISAAIAAHGDPNVPLPPGPLEFHDPEGCKKAFLSGGFAEPAVSELQLVMKYPGARTVLDVICKSMVRTRALLEGQPARVRGKVERAILEGAGKFEKNREIVIAMPALMAVARKP